jgi:dGTPase
MKNLREKIEETLADYSVKSSATYGRQYPEKEHTFRTPFQRDRDRIIHSTAFRRLEYKTQVFIYHEGEYYRSRLTHTLEVQQIARTIARVFGLNEDLVESISLAHDIGHTPFGHKGESTLNELMKEEGGFEHNRQGLRIVDKLEKKYTEFPGLNLSFEAREGIIRHTTSYDMPLNSPEFKEFTKYNSPSLEAQIVNFADEIAYTCHDLDDGLQSGIIEFGSLDNITLWKELEAVSNVKNLSEQLKRNVMIRRLINYLVTDLVKQSSENINNAKPRSVAEVRNSQLLLAHSQEVKEKHTQLRKFLEENMYQHYEIMRMAQKASRIIEELFNSYLKEPRQLPPDIQKKIENDPKKVVICDYIAGMTDRVAQFEYRKLCDLNSLV